MTSNNVYWCTVKHFNIPFMLLFFFVPWAVFFVLSLFFISFFCFIFLSLGLLNIDHFRWSLNVLLIIIPLSLSLLLIFFLKTCSLVLRVHFTLFFILLLHDSTLSSLISFSLSLCLHIHCLVTLINGYKSFHKSNRLVPVTRFILFYFFNFILFCLLFSLTCSHSLETRLVFLTLSLFSVNGIKVWDWFHERRKLSFFFSFLPIHSFFPGLNSCCSS